MNIHNITDQNLSTIEFIRKLEAEPQETRIVNYWIYLNRDRLKRLNRRAITDPVRLAYLIQEATLKNDLDQLVILNYYRKKLNDR